MREHASAVWRRSRLSGMKRLLSRIVVLDIAGLSSVQLSYGQAYPGKPIRVIIPFMWPAACSTC
jgi:hypothetical protein